MKTSEIKQKLHGYIDSAGEKKLKAILYHFRKRYE